MITLTDDILDIFKRDAVSAYPKECCALVIIAKGRQVYVPCQNLAPTPADHFVMAAEDYASAEDRGEVVALCHSHPDVAATPSVADRVACEASGVPWFIVSVLPEDGVPIAGNVASIEPEGFEAPLVGRPFHHGTLDCWTLCRDWYARTWGLTLPDPAREADWWKDGSSDHYTDNLEPAGFTIDVDVRAIQRGDLILMQVQSDNDVPNHAAVYLGDGIMLHHMMNRLSSRDVYGGQWALYTRRIVRHRNAPPGGVMP